MRKVILQNFVTLDGFASAPYGDIDFIVSNKELDGDFKQATKNIDTILLGSKTYHMFSQYWPFVTTETELIADFVNTTPKLVFSQSLEQAPWGDLEAAHVISGDAVQEIAKLKEQSGKDMILWGSVSLGHTLINAGMIDEYQIRVCPSVVGQGKRPWPDGAPPADLKLVETKTYEDIGVVVLRYQPDGKA